MNEKKLVKVQGCSHKRSARRVYKRLQTTERFYCLFILPRNEGLPQKIQTEHTETPITKSETCYIKKIKKRTMRLVFWNSLATESVRCNEQRSELRSSKKQTDKALSRIFFHLQYKVRSHNPKGGRASRKKEKRIPVFDHTYCIQFLNITALQNSIKENGNTLNSLYRYKAIVRCTHVVARILQHG